jgi:hypothetical protein
MCGKLHATRRTLRYCATIDYRLSTAHVTHFVEVVMSLILLVTLVPLTTGSLLATLAIALLRLLFTAIIALTARRFLTTVFSTALIKFTIVCHVLPPLFESSKV